MKDANAAKMMKIIPNADAILLTIFQLSIFSSPKCLLLCPLPFKALPKYAILQIRKELRLKLPYPIGSVVLTVSSPNRPDWAYRIFERRTISIKAKNQEVHKIAAIDLVTNLPLGIEVSKEVPFEELELEKEYLASLKVYTARDITGVAPDSVEFFKVEDVDQSMEDFIKTYWLYPKLIKFELVELEPL